MRMLRNLAAGAAVALATLPTAVSADAVADFYKDKTVTIVVAARAGGGHWNFSQLIAPYLKKHLPGHPTVITQAMGGAGGTKAANFLYNRVPRDGTVIGILLADTPFASRLRTTGVKYVADKFQYLGGVERPQSAFIVFRSAGVDTLMDVKKKQVIVGATGKGSQTYILPKLVNGMLGTKFKIVSGYRGMAGIYKAMDGKEVSGFQSGWPIVPTLRPEWVRDDRVVVLATNSLEPLAAWPKAPLLKDLIDDPTDRKIAALLGGNDIIARAWLAPPGVPADRLAALRAAFKDLARDPELVAKGAERKMSIAYVPWQLQQEHAHNITTAHDALFDRMRALME